MMKRASICGVMVLVLVFLAVEAGAVDLNAPGEKKVTVGSEIQRGCDAIWEAASGKDELLQKTMAFDRVFSLNHQKNTDSPGFMLGASFAAWQLIDHRLESKIKESSRNRDIGIGDASLYFRNFRKLQKQLKISDDQLLEATGQIKPFTKDIERWEAKTKVK